MRCAAVRWPAVHAAGVQATDADVTGRFVTFELPPAKAGALSAAWPFTVREVAPDWVSLARNWM